LGAVKKEFFRLVANSSVKGSNGSNSRNKELVVNSKALSQRVGDQKPIKERKQWWSEK
jgi:hypothetical protein